MSYQSWTENGYGMPFDKADPKKLLAWLSKGPAGSGNGP